jgi:hypothetical protein
MQDPTINSGSIAFLGFGEAAHAFLDGWRTNADFKAHICSYDIKSDSPDNAVRTAKRVDYAAAKVLGASKQAVGEASILELKSGKFDYVDVVGERVTGGWSAIILC